MRFDSGRTVDVATVERLAEVFGIDAEPRHLDDEYGSRWLVGSASPSEPTLWVLDSTPHTFEFSLPHRTIDASTCDTSAWASTVPGQVVPGCEELLLPPDGLQDAAAAERAARDLMIAVGENPVSYGFDSVERERTTEVRASPTSGGLDTVADWRFSFDGRDLPVHVTGVIDEPQSAVEYDLVGLDAALDRLGEAPAMGWTFGEGRSIASTDPAGYPTSVPPFPGPATTSPGGELEVLIVDVRIDHVAGWTPDGTLVLLPAYRFVSDLGYERVVRGVTDEVLDRLAEGPAEWPLLRDRAGLDDLVGLAIDDFTARADDLGYTTRVVIEDGESLGVTADYRTDRANVAVVDDVVTSISSIG